MSCVCVLRPVSVFCGLRMLGANTMLGAMENVRLTAATAQTRPPEEYLWQVWKGVPCGGD